jgi:hypothetical protein
LPPSQKRIAAIRRTKQTKTLFETVFPCRTRPFPQPFLARTAAREGHGALAIEHELTALRPFQFDRQNSGKTGLHSPLARPPSAPVALKKTIMLV